MHAYQDWQARPKLPSLANSSATDKKTIFHGSITSSGQIGHQSGAYNRAIDDAKNPIADGLAPACPAPAAFEPHLCRRMPDILAGYPALAR